jgi:sugar lactone lactonase YvrE
MGVIFDLKADSDFSSLASYPEFAETLNCMAKNGETVTRAKLSVTLPGEDLLPEDLAYDAKTQRFLVSSIRRMQILDTTGKVLATSPWPILALAIDERRRTLWATTGWLPQCESCKAEDKDKTALLAFNLDTGQRLARIESPVPGLLGDLTISSKGDVYVAEGAHGAILVLKHGAFMLERLDTEGEFASPQQPALSADGKTLFVADYLRGIAAIDLATKTVTWQQPGSDVALNGIDGLQLDGDSFIAVQNGTNPQRILRISKDLKSQQVLEANWAGLGEPTHGIVVGREYFFLAQTGWNSYEDSGRKRAGSAPVVSSIWKLPLD